MSLDGPLQLHVQICHLQLVLDNLLGKIKMIYVFSIIVLYQTRKLEMSPSFRIFNSITIVQLKLNFSEQASFSLSSKQPMITVTSSENLIFVFVLVR